MLRSTFIFIKAMRHFTYANILCIYTCILNLFCYSSNGGLMNKHQLSFSQINISLPSKGDIYMRVRTAKKKKWM